MNHHKKIISYIIVFFIILISFVCFSSTTISIDYQVKGTADNQKLDILYFNGNLEGYPYGGEGFYQSKVLNASKDAVQTITFKSKNNSEKMVRLNFSPNIEEIKIDNIKVKYLGIKIKEKDANDIINEFKVVNHSELNVKEGSVNVLMTGEDPYIENDEFITQNTVIIKWCINVMLSLVLTAVCYVIFSIVLKNNGQLILSFCFIFVLIIPLISSFYRQNTGSSSLENRELASFPIVSKDNIHNYSKLVEEYFNDNLPFRSELIELNSFIKYKIFNTSPIDRVVVGKNDWLFYDSVKVKDGDTIKDYLGTNHYTDDQLSSIKDNLIGLQEYLDSEGIQLILMITPNKSQVYGEHMPDYFVKRNTTTKADELIQYLNEETSLSIVYPKDKLIAYKNEADVYYKNDTHWNEIGAFIGYTDLMKTIDPNLEITDLSDLTIESYESNYGDLSNMASIQSYVSETIYNIKDYKANIETELVDSKVDQTYYRYKSSTSQEKKLLMFRDSFSDLMIPNISKNFSESVFLKDFKFDKTLIETEKPDVVVLQIVERTIDKLEKDMGNWSIK